MKLNSLSLRIDEHLQLPLSSAQVAGMSSVESSAANDIWRNTSSTEAQGLHHTHGLFIRENGKKTFSQQNCLVPLAVCAPSESSLSPRPLQLGWHRVSADTAANAHSELKAPLGFAYTTVTLRSLVLQVTHQ